MKRFIIWTICLCLPLFIIHSALASVFSDVASNHQYYKAITYLQENDIVQGYSDNTFRPDQKVNRAEALKIILLGSNVLVPEIQAQEIFPDVMHDSWYSKYVSKAKNLGIVKGDDGTGLFRPGDTVNLAEALKMLLKTNGEDGITPYSNPYLDVHKDSWHSPYFEYARQAELLDQSSYENVYPGTSVTRGLLAELMYRLATGNFIVADGKASYYGEKFHGKTTANGETFDASGLTAAHLTYPFHTWLKVTNAENGESVVVRINDRGPYVSDPTRIIDLSKAAFEAISPLSRGIISVKVETTYAPPDYNVSDTEETAADTTETPSADLLDQDLIKGDLLGGAKIDCPEADSLSYISKISFDNITLGQDIPTRFILDEILTLTGSTSVNTDVVSAFIVDSDDNQTAFDGKVISGKFSVNIRFPKEGAFSLGIIPGESGTSIVQDVKVLKNTCIEEVESVGLTSPSNFALNVSDGNTVISWDRDDYNLFKLTFSQGGLHKSYILHDLDEWRPFYNEFSTFIAADVELALRGATLTQGSVLEPAQIVWSPSYYKNFIASTHHEYNINEDEAELLSLTETSIINETIKATFKPKVSVRSKAAVILPNGKVHEITLTSSSLSPTTNQFDIDVFSASDKSLIASYKSKATGVHFLEINNAEGLAVINVPVYIRNQFPLLPNIRDLSDKLPVNLGSNLTNLRNEMLAAINEDRSDFGLSPLVLDDSLSLLAQFRSDDMVNNNYFGHWDKQGRNANDLRTNYGIQPLVGENLARDINTELAEYGLMRSAIHRSNIISEEWTRVGFGISKLSDGSYAFVQIFSTDPIDLDDIDNLRNNILEAINDNRSGNLALAANLNSLAQSWSEQMVDEDFFDFTDGSGQTLVDTIRAADVNASLGTYIMGNSSFADALEQIGGNEQVQESKWTNLGIGIKQDNLGIIKITLIYTE